MNKTTVSIVVIVLIVIAGSAFLLLNNNDASTIPADKEGGTTLGTPAQTEEKRIVIQGHTIPLEPLTVPVGTTVVFENRDSFAGLPYDSHTITTGTVDPSGKNGVQGVVPNSGSGNPDGLINVSLDTNETFSFTFGEPGSYTFYIAEHPNVSGQGQITVIAVEETSVGNDVITMEARSFSFTPDTILTSVGETVNLDITAIGQHTFTIDELGVNVVLPHGETTKVEFIPNQTGIYEFYCSVPGHRQAGQIGTLTVE